VPFGESWRNPAPRRPTCARSWRARDQVNISRPADLDLIWTCEKLWMGIGVRWPTPQRLARVTRTPPSGSVGTARRRTGRSGPRGWPRQPNHRETSEFLSAAVNRGLRSSVEVSFRTSATPSAPTGGPGQANSSSRCGCTYPTGLRRQLMVESHLDVAGHRSLGARGNAPQSVRQTPRTRERPTAGAASGEGATQTEANEHAND
jgi:hypothetical protein